MGADRAASHQRSRLMGAMIAAVDQNGYGAVSVEMLAGLAGVSKSAFYRQFEDKEACFLRTFEEIVEQGAARIEADSSRASEPRAQLRAAFEAFLALAADAGPAARLVFLASLEVGREALAARERAAEPFRQILARIFEVPEHEPNLVIRALVGGTHEVVYRRLRDDEPERLRAEVESLIEWGLAYWLEERQPDSIGQRLLDQLGPPPMPIVQGSQEELWDWAEPLDGTGVRARLSQRDRILRATAQVAVEGEYLGLSVGAISARAGTSNQTFYENFSSKEEAFMVAFDTLALRSYEVVSAAFRKYEGRITAGAAAMTAMLSLLARDTLYSRLAFIELPSAGQVGWERAEAMLETFIALLEPDLLPPEVRARPPRVVLEAIGGGIWTIVRQEISAGRGQDLTLLAPELIDFSLCPFDVE